MISLFSTLLYGQDKEEEITGTTIEQSTYSGLYSSGQIETLSAANGISKVEHYNANIFVGFLAGGTIGLLSSLTLFSNTNTPITNNLIIFSITGSSIGALTGFLFTIIESIYNKPFSIGKSFLQFEFYSAIVTSLLGIVTGSIIYAVSGSNNLHLLAEGAGYGSFTGILVGFVLYFALGKYNIVVPKNISIRRSPLNEYGISIAYVF